MSLLEIIFSIIALLIAVTVHEFSHAWLADYFGDPTPRSQGRVTLNPIAHLDLIGTFFLFFYKFGWGKPVQINPRFFRHPIQESALVSFAGPFSNFVFALVLAGIVHLTKDNISYYIEAFLLILIVVNLGLGVFNLIPLPPLDGSKVLGLFIPKRFQLAYENFLEKGVFYTAILLLFDFIVLPGIIGHSLMGEFIHNAVNALTAALFLQQ